MKRNFFTVSGDKFIRNVYNEKNFCIKMLNFPVVFKCLFCFLSIVNIIKQVCQQQSRQWWVFVGAKISWVFVFLVLFFFLVPDSCFCSLADFSLLSLQLYFCV